MSVKADADVIYVDVNNTGLEDGSPANPYNTIQEAINAASPGDTIFVRSGTYYEHVIVNKSVSLVGEKRYSTIIDGNETGNVITITANNVSIEVFTIKRSGPWDNGIYVDYSSGNHISHNTITNNQAGIELWYFSKYNSISGNNITNNNNGIRLWRCQYNSISGNNITANKYYGIWLDESSDNKFYHNNFIDNTQQVYIETPDANIWDDGYPSGGNYWSEYEEKYPDATELDGSGIWDTPYVIYVNNQDNHPLMGMFSDFPITLERETYHVTNISNSTISEFRFEIGAETGNKIIRFNAAGKDSTVGFCRVKIPTELMNYPYIVLVDVEEIVPTLIDDPKETYVYLYFTYIHSSHAITIISSRTLYLYNELLDNFVKLQIDLYNLNATYYDLLKSHCELNSSYYDLLNSYGLFLDDYSQLQESYRGLNSSYYDLLNSYGLFLGNYSQFQESYRGLNSSYYDLLNSYGLFLDDYSQLQESYEDHLSDYSKNVDNMQNLMYIFAATTAIFIITTIYLSKRAHAGKTKVFENKK